MDTDQKPSIGYVYDGIYRPKKAIKDVFMHKKRVYKPFTNIIKGKYVQKERNNGCFIEMVTTLIGDKSIQRKCIDEVGVFQDRLGSFGRPLALDSSKTMQPDEYWKFFGCGALNLQNLAS
ncbi:hypothetical protein ACS0TY_021284 [Phlomoides rotata]